VVEGIAVAAAGAFSVQYHPEAGPGPHDARYLFGEFESLMRSGGPRRGDLSVPRREDIESILVIGSGPIVIGQACEFDLLGTQACRVLREEGLPGSSSSTQPGDDHDRPATADRTYVEPLDPAVLEAVIERERPDALLPHAGGQDGPHLTMALAGTGVFEAVRRGSDRGRPEAIATAEDRRAVQAGDGDIGLEVPESGFAHSVAEALEIATRDRVPGDRPAELHPRRLGIGDRRHADALASLAETGIDASPVREVLVERSIVGWKEYELEVMRDRADNCVVVCSIENLDPDGGAHRGLDHRGAGPDPDRRRVPGDAR